MEKGDQVKIVPSKELSGMKLDGLCNRRGVIKEILDSENRKVKGCWVVLTDGLFQDESEWFVPQCSIQK